VSRYTILLILNAPFVLAGFVNALVNFKLSRISKRHFVMQWALWLVVLAGLAGARPIYEFLFSNNLTVSEPLSLFDVIQITGIIIVIFMANRSRTKLDMLERRVQDLHQELSIRLSEERSQTDKK
jgi:hypothetical protein